MLNKKLFEGCLKNKYELDGNISGSQRKHVSLPGSLTTLVESIKSNYNRVIDEDQKCD